jgi:hypothetical protein
VKTVRENRQQRMGCTINKVGKAAAEFEKTDSKFEKTFFCE